MVVPHSNAALDIRNVVAEKERCRTSQDSIAKKDDKFEMHAQILNRGMMKEVAKFESPRPYEP